MNIDICDLQKIKSRLIQECKENEYIKMVLCYHGDGLYLNVSVNNMLTYGIIAGSIQLNLDQPFNNKRIKKITKYFLSTLFDNGEQKES